MKSPPKQISHTNEYLTCREKQVLRAIQADPEARKSLEFLARKGGMTQEFLVIHFVLEAWSFLGEDQFGTHQQRRDLKSLAERLLRLSGSVKKANELPEWRFVVPRVDLLDCDRDRLRTSFMELPKTLSLYARNMLRKINVIELDKRKGARSPRKALELEFADALVELIKLRTGHPYHDHVAAVQRIAYQVAGRTVLPASGETLRKRDFRKREALTRHNS